ncbi:uncharacterized protein METZ01_LOCUS213111 [marine metagenome]|uniref:beta-galactoside alpha-(2,6)-sialyltransferase n=1 Tax=marine metagenome TaxID=408172 RepID=A0A382FDR5_9ZZZZ
MSNVQPELELDTNIAIIGSGGQLLNDEAGDEIDDFAEVVRFNRAPTEGFEKYVGSKTTLRIANNHVFENIPHNADESWKDAGQPANFILNQRSQRIMLLNKHTEGWRQKDKHVHESCQKFLGDFNTAESYGGIYAPTVGYAFIVLCLLDNIIPTLFGFGIEEDSNSASHYWEDKGKNTSHQYGGERERLKEWATESLLVIK